MEHHERIGGLVHTVVIEKKVAIHTLTHFGQMRAANFRCSSADSLR